MMVNRTRNTKQTWFDVERLAQQEIQRRLPDNYEVLNSGLSNSTNTDLTILKDSLPHKKLEVKKLPSVAGVQTVLKEDGNGNYVSFQNLPFTETMVSLANRERDSLNVRLTLTGESENLAFKAFQQKYETEEVDIILGFTESGILASSTTHEAMRSAFNAHLIIRPKKSGSARLSKTNYELIKEDLKQYSFSTDRRKVEVDDLAEVSAIQTVLDKYDRNLYINKSGEIRQLSKTNNLTMLLSLSEKVDFDKIAKKSYDQIVEMII